MKQVLCHRSRSVGGTAATSYSSFPGTPETHTTEAEVQCIWPTAGVFNNLIINLAVAPGAGKSWTYTLRKNAVDTSIVVTISDAATTGRDITNSVTVAAGDELTLKVVPAGSPTTPGTTGLCVTADFTGTTAKESGYAWPPQNVDTSATRWQGVFANASVWNVTSGPTVETVVAAAGDITALYLNSGAGGPGGGTKTYTVHIYKNGVKQDGTGGTVNTGVAISGAATTASGTFTLPVVAGDLLYVECVPTNSPNLMGLGCGFRFVATTDGESQFCGFSPSNMNTAAARYSQPEGEVSVPWDATEASVVAYAGVTSFGLKKLQVKLQGTPGAGKSYTLDARRNSTSPASTTSATVADAATTGSDATANVTSYVDGDTLSIRSVPAGTPTARAASWGFIQTVGLAIQGSAVFGVTTTVTATRAIACGLDGNVNVHSDTGKFKVFGDFEVTGTSTIGGVGDVVGPASSVDGEVALYDGTTGKLLERATGTGVARVTSGVWGTPGNVNLASEVTGDLPFANLAQASAASKLLGRGSASGAGDYEEVAVGSGLTMTGTTLSASGGGSGDVVGPASSVDAEIVLFDSTTGKLLKRATGTGFVRAAAGVYSAAKFKRTIGITIDGGGSVITTGVKGFVTCPVAGTITKARLLSTDAAVTSGSIVIDVWKDAYASYPPTVADTITASAKPTLSSATKSEDSTLTGWTTAVSAGDVFGFKVDSITSLIRVVLELTVEE